MLIRALYTEAVYSTQALEDYCPSSFDNQQACKVSLNDISCKLCLRCVFRCYWSNDGKGEQDMRDT